MFNIPAFIMLVGIPGSGKTTIAERLLRDYAAVNIDIGMVHISSDNIREDLYGDASIQGDPSEVFSVMHKRTLEALDNGDSVIYDATNVSRKDRASILSKLPAYVTKECMIVWAPIETCIERDVKRDRSVGRDVIDRMVKRFQAPYFDEGFDYIYPIMPESFDAMDYENDLIDSIYIPHDNPHHTSNVIDHCKLARKYIKDKYDGDDDLRRAAFLHDIGKAYTKSVKDAKGNNSEIAHYYGHQNVGAWQSYGIDGVGSYIPWLISNHMEPFFNSKYYKSLPAFLKQDIDLLHEADLNAH